MPTLTVYEAALTAREVYFPEACPECSTSFLEGANLIQYSLLDCEALTGDLDGDGFEVDDNGQPLEEVMTYPTSYACAHCSKMIVPGQVHVEEIPCQACDGKGWLEIDGDTSSAHIEACDDCTRLDEAMAIAAARSSLGERMCQSCENLNPCPTHERS